MLLESYSKQVEEIVNEVESLASNVAQTKEVIELILDSSRNALLALDLKVSITTASMASGALVAGLFGMNVRIATIAKEERLLKMCMCSLLLP